MRTWRGAIGLSILGMAIGCGGSSGPSSPSPTPTPTSPTLTAPAPDSPGNDSQLDTLRPTLIVRNGTSTVAGTRTYEFQISDSSDFASSTAPVAGLAVTVSQTGVPEGAGGTTSFTPTSDLQPSTRMYWRARVSQAGATSSWSPTSQFRTKLVGFNRA